MHIATKTKIRLAGIAYRAIAALRGLVGRGPHTTVNRRGIRWQLDLSEGIDFSIYLLGSFEPSTVSAYERLIRHGNTVIDIGANIGAHTLPLARCAGERGRVIAFEPTQFAYEKLRRNISLNPALAKRIRAEQIMLTATPAEPLAGTLYSSWRVTGNSETRHRKHLGEAMPTDGARAMPLDDYLAASGIARVDFIKMDVDGHECAVLHGAARTLATSRPVLLMEIMPYGLSETGASLEQLLTQLRSSGYRLQRLEDHAPLPADAENLAALIPAGGSINVIANPAAP